MINIIRFLFLFYITLHIFNISKRNHSFLTKTAFFLITVFTNFHKMFDILMDFFGHTCPFLPIILSHSPYVLSYKHISTFTYIFITYNSQNWLTLDSLSLANNNHVLFYKESTFHSKLFFFVNVNLHLLWKYQFITNIIEDKEIGKTNEY